MKWSVSRLYWGKNKILIVVYILTGVFISLLNNLSASYYEKRIQGIDNGATAGKGILFDYYFTVIRQLVPSIIFSLIFMWSISKTITYIILAGYTVVFIVTNLLLKILYKFK